jgi:hypothetical protein
MEHFYQKVDGWFNMEKQYLELLSHCPDGGTLVELGAWKGKSTCFIATEIIKQKRNLKFYTIDTFEGTSELSDIAETSVYNKQDKNILDQFIKNTTPVKDNLNYIISKSHEAAKEFDNFSVDSIFIDAGHSYESVKKDIECWYPKMKKNSIISGHDYTEGWPGVMKAVNEFFGKPDKVENSCWFKYL